MTRDSRLQIVHLKPSDLLDVVGHKRRIELLGMVIAIDLGVCRESTDFKLQNILPEEPHD